MNHLIETLRHTYKHRVPRLRAAGRRSAVAIILRDSNSSGNNTAASGSTRNIGTEVLYIKRASRAEDPWSGHVAFPGGKREGDESDMECAVRETLEEIGLDLGRYTFVGRLDDYPVYRGGEAIPDSAYCVGVWYQGSGVSATPPLTLQVDEVAEVRWMSVGDLTRLDPRGITRPATRFLPWITRLPLPLRRALHLEDVYLPAVPFPPPHPGATPFLLWGMSLQATSDFLVQAGVLPPSEALTWPPFHTDSPVVNFVVGALCGAIEVGECVAGKRPWGACSGRHVGSLVGLVGGGGVALSLVVSLVF